MKNKLKIIGFSILAIIAIAFISNVFEYEKTFGNASALNRVYMSKGGNSGTQTAVATTTEGVTFMTTGTASTTFPFLTDKTDNVRLDVNFVGSTSAVMVYNIQYSNDNLPCDTDQNRCNWFNEVITNSQTPTASSTNTVLTPVTYTLTGPSAGVTTTPSILIDGISARYTRVKFSVSGASGAVWMQATKQVQLAN